MKIGEVVCVVLSVLLTAAVTGVAADPLRVVFPLEEVGTCIVVEPGGECALLDGGDISSREAADAVLAELKRISTLYSSFCIRSIRSFDRSAVSSNLGDVVRRLDQSWLRAPVTLMGLAPAVFCEDALDAARERRFTFHEVHPFDSLLIGRAAVLAPYPGHTDTGDTTILGYLVSFGDFRLLAIMRPNALPYAQHGELPAVSVLCLHSGSAAMVVPALGSLRPEVCIVGSQSDPAEGSDLVEVLPLLLAENWHGLLATSVPYIYSLGGALQKAEVTSTDLVRISDGDIEIATDGQSGFGVTTADTAVAEYQFPKALCCVRVRDLGQRSLVNRTGSVGDVSFMVYMDGLPQSHVDLSISGDSVVLLRITASETDKPGYDDFGETLYSVPVHCGTSIPSEHSVDVEICEAYGSIPGCEMWRLKVVTEPVLP